MALRPLRTLAVLLASSACAGLPARAGAQSGGGQVLVYRCVDTEGRVALRDTPCANGERQETRAMARPAATPAVRDGAKSGGDTTPGTAPATPAPPPPPRVIVVREAAPAPMYECTTPDNTTYTSDSSEGNPRWVPMWTLGWPVPAGTWVRDACRALPRAETCARLRDRRDAIERRFFNAMPSERARLEVEERGIDARLAADCGGR